MKIVVFGGDKPFNGTWPNGFEVDFVHANRGNLLHLVNGINFGHVKHVIVMTRWLNHNQYEVLRGLRNKIKLHVWTRGLNELAKSGVVSLIGA